MMRALAEFIMRGRFQACLVALAGNLFPLISPATVGLVTLKQTLVDGSLVLLWAALPLLAALFLTTASPLVVTTSLVGLISLLLSAEVLKKTASWQFALVTVLLSCGIGMQLAGVVLSGETGSVITQVNELLADLEGSAGSAVSPLFLLMAIIARQLGVDAANGVLILGFLAWLTGIGTISALLLARWWQALLYNPGGFQQEMHGLRLSGTIAAILMVLILGCMVIAPEYSTWASLLSMPLLLAGIGLVHFAVKARRLGKVWLIVMYVGLVLLGPVPLGPLSMVLIVAGFLDSYLNLRTRLGKSGQSQ